MIATLKPNGDAISDATDGKELEWSSWFGRKNSRYYENIVTKENLDKLGVEKRVNNYNKLAVNFLEI